jgi:hypothetical protein
MDASANASADGEVRLHCLGGGPAPPDLGADLRRLLRLPPEALEKFWQVLAPSLASNLPPEAEQLLDVYCAAYKIDDEDLARAIKACRFVIREAARRDAPAGAVADDLDRVCGDAPLVKELILAGYEPARAQIRHEIVRAALADHGNLLVGMKWRLDAVQASEQGSRLATPVAMLTLHYRDGTETKRLTLQVLPDMMGELKAICEQVLG